MAAWWKVIATNLNALGSSTGQYPKRVAFFLSAQSLTGFSWQQKIANQKNLGSRGAYGRRMVDFTKPIAQTAYGTAGSWGRIVANQNLLNTNKPSAGQHAVQVPVGGLGVHP